VLESLRAKQKGIVEQRDDEIGELRLKLSDTKDIADRHRIERDGLRMELDKLQD
jgi:hypothetical protein